MNPRGVLLCLFFQDFLTFALILNDICHHYKHIHNNSAGTNAESTVQCELLSKTLFSFFDDQQFVYISG